MGEYATFKGEQVKIGTCESMYYLRADQTHEVQALSGNVDPVRDRAEIRFRFPFPDEDAIVPGAFEDYDRGVRIPGGWQLPAENEGHYSVQFVARPPGYVLSIPCPEQFGQPGLAVEMPGSLRVGRNGWSGDPVVRAQRYVDGCYWTGVACGACGAMWRLTPEQGAGVADAFIAEAERQEYRRDLDAWGPARDNPSFYLKMAERILAGYRQAVAA